MTERLYPKNVCLCVLVLFSLKLNAWSFQGPLDREWPADYEQEERDMEEIRNSDTYDDNGVFDYDEEEEAEDEDDENTDSGDNEGDDYYGEVIEEVKEEEYNNNNDYNAYGGRYEDDCDEDDDDNVYQNSRKSTGYRDEPAGGQSLKPATGGHATNKKQASEDPPCVNIAFTNTGDTDITVTAFNVQEWKGHECNDDKEHYYFRDVVKPGDIWWLKGWNSGPRPSGLEIKSMQGYKNTPGYYVECVDNILEFPFEWNLIRCRPSLSRPEGTYLGFCNCTETTH